MSVHRISIGYILVSAGLLVQANGSTLSASTQVCFGYFGTGDHLQPACGQGGKYQGGGAAIAGGSGAGSGLNFPFALSHEGLTEFSASTAALQDYGTFRAFANIHIQEQMPGIFGGGGGASASGESIDTLTLNGPAGQQGRLIPTFSVTGGTASNVYSVNDNGSAGAEAYLSIVARLTGPGLSGGTAYSPLIQTGGDYSLKTGESVEGLVFTFGVPFQLQIDSQVAADGGYDRLNPPSFFRLDSSTSFDHTSILTGIAATDLFGNPISGFTITSESGTHYPLSSQVIGTPEPSGLYLGGIAGMLLLILSRRLGLTVGAAS